MSDNSEIALIIYTTKYREGGAKFEQVARTMTKELNGYINIICKPVNSKKDIRHILQSIIVKSLKIKELHFIGHSGMYGPMYGNIDYPEQFSPYEWKHLNIPFTSNAKAYFHCCRSARWFAPFFASTFNIETLGYHWYTSFSANKNKFKISRSKTTSLYAIGCKGKKSHGYLGSIKKHLFGELETMKSFNPEHDSDGTYNSVAHLYDAVFKDIKVREDEWNWITKQLPVSKDIRVLDIGCGNGALLKELSPRIKQGIGIDLSEAIIGCAEDLNKDNHNLSFAHINGPHIPLEDNSIDFAISMLSFRYLDWDPLMQELERVIAPGGSMIILDMVAVPAKTIDYPTLLKSKFKHYKHRKKYPAYYKALQTLVSNPNWTKMLTYNPIRSEHEMTWYLESRFPGQKVEKINIGYHSSVIAFNTANFQNIKALALTYP